MIFLTLNPQNPPGSVILPELTAAFQPRAAARAQLGPPPYLLSHLLTPLPWSLRSREGFTWTSSEGWDTCSCFIFLILLMPQVTVKIICSVFQTSLLLFKVQSWAFFIHWWSLVCFESPLWKLKLKIDFFLPGRVLPFPRTNVEC